MSHPNYVIQICARCFNKAMTDNQTLSYVIGKGEDRWDCEATDDAEMREYNVKLAYVIINCKDVRGDCHAVYNLKLVFYN